MGKELLPTNGTPWEAAMADAMLALEQTVDTVLPEFYFYDKFKPFAEDILPGIVAGKRFLAAHPAGAKPCPVDLQEPAVLTIGPEGGFTDYETEVWSPFGSCSEVAAYRGDGVIHTGKSYLLAVAVK